MFITQHNVTLHEIILIRSQQSNKSPKEFAEELLKQAHQYNGFNLILADICTSSIVYVFNRPKPGYVSVIPGIHVLTNATLDAPWPKVHEFNYVYKYNWYAPIV